MAKAPKIPDTPRSLAIKARLYRFLALIFAGTGLLIFIYLYMKNIRGDFAKTLSEPSYIAMLVIPFLPCFVLSVLASRIEKEYFKMTKSK